MTDTKTKKRLRLPLLLKILLGIILGIGFGCITPMWGARLCATFSAIFSQLLGFLVPLIIVGFVVPAIADIGKSAGKMLVVTALLAYAMTIMSGMFSFFTSDWLFPSVIKSEPALATVENVGGMTVEPFFQVPIPPLMDIMTALILSFMLDWG